MVHVNVNLHRCISEYKPAAAIILSGSLGFWTGFWTHIIGQTNLNTYVNAETFLDICSNKTTTTEWNKAFTWNDIKNQNLAFDIPCCECLLDPSWLLAWRGDQMNLVRVLYPSTRSYNIYISFPLWIQNNTVSTFFKARSVFPKAEYLECLHTHRCKREHIHNLEHMIELTFVQTSNSLSF